MMKEKKKKKGRVDRAKHFWRKHNGLLYASGGVATGAAVILILSPWLISLQYSDLDSQSKYAGTFAAASALFSGIGLAGIVTTLLFQYRELRVQRHDSKRTNKAMRESLDIQRRSQLGEAFGELVLRGYLDRSFSSVDPPTGYSTKVHQVLKQERLDPGWSTKLHEPGTAANLAAYETSVAMERVGIGVFIGLIDLSFFLAFAGERFVRDWVTCREMVEGVIRKPSVNQHSPDDPTAVPFERRHAEWLAILCALWIAENYPEHYSPKEFFGERTMAQWLTRFYQLTKKDSRIMPIDVAKSVAKVLGVDEGNLAPSKP